MPRTIKVVIRPHVDQIERNQNIDGLVQQFKQYYCQAREESLKNLAVTLEDQAFRHAETREQYSYNLQSLSSQEFEKATQLHAEINASVPPDGHGFGTSLALFNDTIGAEIAQEEANPIWADSNGDEGNLNGCLSQNDNKARQQMARQRIMTRRRKRAQTAGKIDPVSQAHLPLLALEETTHILPENTVGLLPDFQHESDKRGVKRCQTEWQHAEAGVAEWINEFCDGNVDAGNAGASFLEELPQDTFGIEECNDIETCFSSSHSCESKGPARKRGRMVEENSE